MFYFTDVLIKAFLKVINSPPFASIETPQESSGEVSIRIAPSTRTGFGISLLFFCASLHSMASDQSCIFQIDNGINERVRVKITTAVPHKKVGTIIVAKTLEPDECFNQDIGNQNVVIEYKVINKGKFITWREEYTQDRLVPTFILIGGW